MKNFAQRLYQTLRLLLALLVLLIVGLAGTFRAAQAGEHDCGSYEVALYELGSLYYRDDAKNFVGIDKDVVEELAKRTGCELRTTLDSRVRIWLHLAEGSLDMTTSGIPTPEREQFARFIIYFQTRNHLLMSNELATRIDSLRTFYGDPKLRLAVVKSFKHGKAFESWIDSLRVQGRVDEYVDAEAVARAFAQGRADAFLSLPVAWGPLLKRNQLEGKVSFLDLAPDDRVPHGLVLSRKRVPDAVAERLRKGIEAMRDDGTLERIYRTYLSADVVRRIVP